MPGSFKVATTDGHMPEVADHNEGHGFYRLSHGARPLYDKVAQHRVLRAISPQLALEGYAVQGAQALPAKPARELVIRPSLSPTSRGCALMVGPDDPLKSADREWLAGTGEEFLVHQHVPGVPYLLNGVISGGRLILSDIWECRVSRCDGRPILVAVINACSSALPSNAHAQLERVALEFGIMAGPVHFEVVLAQDGIKLVKFSPRIASSPLPELCALLGRRGQQELYAQAAQSGFTAVFPDVGPPKGFVADYSFIFKRSGNLTGIRVGPALGLAHFSSVFHQVEVGQRVHPTRDGLSYGFTIFLKSESRAALIGDLDRLDRMQGEGVFDYD